MPLRYLSAGDVRRALPMRRAIDVMRGAFAALAAGKVNMPVRLGVPSDEGVALFMPASIAGIGLGQKTVSVFGQNSRRGLPTIHALVTLLDPSTGAPAAILEGAYLTRLRTGAVTGLACDILAAPAAGVLTVFGAGAQAPSQIDAVCAVRPIHTVQILSRSDGAARLAEERMRADPARRYSAVPLSERDAAVASADVIVTATTSTQPLFDGALVKPGAFVAAVGAYRADMREVDAALLRRSRVFVDQTDAALEEAGDLIIPMASGEWERESIVCDLAALCAGHPSARHEPDGVAFFKSCGLALEDIAAAAEVLREAERLGLGVTLGA